MSVRPINCVDLFCGAGGTSTGLLAASEKAGRAVRLAAVNHWDTAIQTHTLNHPGVIHRCASVDDVRPQDLTGEGDLDLLWASPECIFHSRARHGKPINDQRRASAWCVCRWAEAVKPGVILIENVMEFENWAPLDDNNRPIKSRKGEIFKAWIAALKALGYRVEWRKFNAADYGEAQARVRLIIQAVRDGRRIAWPEPTHAPAGSGDMFREPYRTARQIIQFDLPSQSIFARKKPLCANTLRRIMSGFKQFGMQGDPWIVARDNTSGDGEWSIDRPLTTVVSKARHGVAQPYLVLLRGTADRQIEKSAVGVDSVLPTVAGCGNIALAQPFLIPQQTWGPPARSIDSPVPTITATTRGMGLAQPFLIKYFSTGGAISVDEPLHTVTTHDRFGLVQPFVEVRGERFAVDIHFRMLNPRELARAQGFTDSYQFAGNSSQTVRQIGNAVPVRLAEALMRAQLAAGNI